MDQEISDFHNELMKLAEKYSISTPELDTLFTYRQVGNGISYQVSDTPNNQFITEAISLFHAYFG